MRYSDNVDYLVSSIIYLGTHSFYWARSPAAMSEELSLDGERLRSVFEGFPGLFRRSKQLASNGQHFYALQARYAQREGEGTGDPDQESYIAPLEVKKLELLLAFVTKMADEERATLRGWVANAISIVAVIFSASAVVWAATLKSIPVVPH